MCSIEVLKRSKSITQKQLKDIYLIPGLDDCCLNEINQLVLYPLYIYGYIPLFYRIKIIGLLDLGYVPYRYKVDLLHNISVKYKRNTLRKVNIGISDYRSSDVLSLHALSRVFHNYRYRQTSSVRRTKSKNLIFFVLSCGCICPIHWSQMLSRSRMKM